MNWILCTEFGRAHSVNPVVLSCLEVFNCDTVYDYEDLLLIYISKHPFTKFYIAHTETRENRKPMMAQARQLIWDTMRPKKVSVVQLKHNYYHYLLGKFCFFK